MSNRIRRQSSRGLSVAWMAIGLPVLFMMAIFGMEIGLLYRTAERTKSAADAAALAAASRILQGLEAASAASVLIVAEHTGPNGSLVILVSPENGPGTELEFGRWHPNTKTFEATTENPNAVKSTINLNADHPNGAVPVFMGGLFNLPYTSMRRQSIAQIRVAPAKPMLLLRSSLGNGILDMADDASIRAPRASIDVASTSAAAVRLSENSLIEAVELTVSGEVQLGENTQLDAALLTGTQPAEDPFDGVPLPSSLGVPIRSPVPETAGQVAIPPGIYESGFQYDQGTYLLSAGLYFLRGDGLALGGTAHVLGTDARVVLEGSNATLQLSGNSILTLGKEPPFPAQGNMTLIAVDSAPVWILDDNTSINIAGSVYAPGVSVRMLDGNWASNASILKDLRLGQDSALNITGNGQIGAQPRRSRAVLVQ